MPYIPLITRCIRVSQFSTAPPRLEISIELSFKASWLVSISLACFCQCYLKRPEPPVDSMWNVACSPISARFSIPVGSSRAGEQVYFRGIDSMLPIISKIVWLEIGPVEQSSFESGDIAQLLVCSMPLLTSMTLKAQYFGPIEGLEGLATVNFKDWQFPALRTLVLDGVCIHPSCLLYSSVLATLETLELRNCPSINGLTLYGLVDFLEAISRGTNVTELTMDGILSSLAIDNSNIKVPIDLCNLRVLNIRDNASLISSFLCALSLPKATACNLTALIVDENEWNGKKSNLDHPSDVYVHHGKPTKFQAMLPHISTTALSEPAVLRATYSFLPGFVPNSLTLAVTATHASILATNHTGTRLSLETALTHSSRFSGPGFFPTTRRQLLRAALRAVPAIFAPSGKCLTVTEMHISADLYALVDGRADVDGNLHSGWAAGLLAPFAALERVVLCDELGLGEEPRQAPVGLARAVDWNTSPALKRLELRSVKLPSMALVLQLKQALQDREEKSGGNRLEQVDVELAVKAGEERTTAFVEECYVRSTMDLLEPVVGSAVATAFKWHPRWL